jgi:hypothetical protein
MKFASGAHEDWGVCYIARSKLNDVIAGKTRQVMVALFGVGS